MSTPAPAEPTAQLISRIRAGDDAARERLFARFVPIMQQWARGRVPPQARGMNETDDFVQATLMNALRHIDTIQVEREGAFFAYLRAALMNGLRDELRKASRRPQEADALEALPARDPSPLDRVIDQAAFDAYEAALATLAPDQQEAVMLRLEFHLSHTEIADAIGCPSADAARAKVARAVARLARALSDHRERPISPP